MAVLVYQRTFNGTQVDSDGFITLTAGVEAQIMPLPIIAAVKLDIPNSPSFTCGVVYVTDLSVKAKVGDVPTEGNHQISIFHYIT